MYAELADWFHLLTSPDEYAEEAGFYLRQLSQTLGAEPRSLLELGSGGGNNAWHYKHHLERVTLTDLSDGMLSLSRQLNPECEHLQGDMRTLRLGREFDVVFVHDAISYLTTEADLRQALQTAFVHLRQGGAALFAPDHVRELFYEGVDCGGHDGDGRGLRYLEWTYDPDPSDTTYFADYAYLLHEDGLPTRTLYDRHQCGLFNRATWLRLLADVGFEEPRAVAFEHSEEPSGSLEVFVARRLRPHLGHEAT
jgi:hypothetical protein